MTRSTDQQPVRPVFDEVLSEGMADGQEFSVVSVSAGSLASGGAPELIIGLPVGQLVVAVEGPWFEDQVEAAWQRAVEEANATAKEVELGVANPMHTTGGGSRRSNRS